MKYLSGILHDSVWNLLVPFVLMGYLLAWLGPPLHQSGNVEYHGNITKQGSKLLRWIMVESARVAVNHDAKMQTFYERVKHRRGDQKAIIAVVNKMLEIIWFMLTRDEPYV